MKNDFYADAGVILHLHFLLAQRLQYKSKKSPPSPSLHIIEEGWAKAARPAPKHDTAKQNLSIKGDLHERRAFEPLCTKELHISLFDA
ncbi:MAG: hypothetical protein IJF15_01455, partial [Oscillospiraceae bacterium]|nr:hypothetical protein [Oscillospiraceae bacterium]